MTWVEVLEWDSEFFGFPIGRVTLDGAGDADLDAIDEEAADLGLRCLYGTLDPTDHLAGFRIQEHGWRLVDVAMLTNRRHGDPQVRPPTRAVVRAGTLHDVEVLRPTIERLGPWSRFAADPNFPPDASRRMQVAWVERAARGVENRFLLVAEEEGEAIALLAGRWEGFPHIDLIVTSKPASRAAELLVNDVMDRQGTDEILWGGPIAARNVASLRFCEGTGVRVFQCRYMFHKWFDQDAG